MRALVICGILLFSETAAARDRTSCFLDCADINFSCRQQCPGVESRMCAGTCVDEEKECKKAV
jgi:hypothetical protein